MLFKSKLPEHLPDLRQLITQNTLSKSDLLTDSFLIEKENDLELFYAPHNEYINPTAEIIIVGITPGWNQMKTAYSKVIHCLKTNVSEEEMLKEAKIAASFSGQMRTNLVSMLNQCGLADALDIATTDSLFSTDRFRLHTTSIIRYPVFYKGKNYTGHLPRIHQSSMLKRYAYGVFPEELDCIKKPALIIPLGKVAEQIVSKVAGNLPYLSGFPHPSGANGHRIKQLTRNMEHLKSLIQTWQGV